MVKYMLSILMDGIKDTNMCIDYAIQAVDMESPYSNWFKSHAKSRLDALVTDYSFISNEISLTQKAKDDDIASALKCHIDYQLNQLKEKYEGI